MEKKACNSESCKNQQLRDINEYVYTFVYSLCSSITNTMIFTINSTIGPKICIDQNEYSHSEALRLLVQREKNIESEEVKSLKSQLQK